MPGGGMKGKAFDIIHGVRVLDPYRWLEDREGPEVEDWVRDQQDRFEQYFADIPAMEALRSEVNDLLSIEKVDEPARVGAYSFFRRSARNQEQPCLYARLNASGGERLLVDPSPQGAFVSVEIAAIAADGRLLSYLVRHGGESAAAIHFVDVATAHVLEDHLERGYTRGLTFASDNSAFYYIHEVMSQETPSLEHQILYHPFGRAHDSDEAIFSIPRTRRSRLSLIADNRNLGAIFIHDSEEGLKVDLYVAARAEHRAWRAIICDREMPSAPFLHGGRIFLVSFSGHPNGQILELNQNGETECVFVEDWLAPIGAINCTVDWLYVTYQVEGKTVMKRRNWRGDLVEQLPVPIDGSFGVLPNYSSDSQSPFFQHESFFEPPSILEYDEPTQSYVPWVKYPESASPHQGWVQQVNYRSKDGEPIPLSLVGLGIPGNVEPRKALMTTYGGFSVSVTPRYSVLVSIMLNRGCVFAIPHVRGGGEGGRSWHQAARGRNRQVAFDDFLAAAEWLCSTGITNSDSLAIFGGSNSGLLVAAAMTQRPELFRAVLCISPILDMVRYEKFGNSHKWREEYGSVEIEEEFRALYEYSPYHRIQEDVEYPATLFVTGDQDQQCDPAHVRKMVARMQQRSIQTRSVLVDYSSERGHTPSLPLSVRIESLTRRLYFLLKELDILFSSEAMR